MKSYPLVARLGQGNGAVHLCNYNPFSVNISLLT